MANLATIVLLAQQEEAPSFLRLLGPVLIILAITIFSWLNEKAKKREQQRQAEEKSQHQGEEQATARQARSVQSAPRPLQQPQRQVRPGTAEQISRYQPEIPLGSEEKRDRRGPQGQEPEPIIVAEDLSAEQARRQLHEQRQRQIHAQAIHRAKAIQAKRQQQAALQAKLAAEKTANLKRSRELHDEKVSAGEKEIFRPADITAPLVAITSAAQVRQAIVWAEIIGPPRAFKPLEQLF